MKTLLVLIYLLCSFSIFSMTPEVSSEGLKHSLSKSTDLLIHIHFVNPSISTTPKSKRRKLGMRDDLCEEESEELEEDLDDAHILYRTNLSSNKWNIRLHKNSYRHTLFSEIYISPLLRPPRS